MSIHTSLYERAATAVANVPADLIGSPRKHAVAAVIDSYRRDNARRPSFGDIIGAVDAALETTTCPARAAS